MRIERLLLVQAPALTGNPVRWLADRAPLNRVADLAAVKRSDISSRTCLREKVVPDQGGEVWFVQVPARETPNSVCLQFCPWTAQGHAETSNFENGDTDGLSSWSTTITGVDPTGMGSAIRVRAVSSWDTACRPCGRSRRRARFSCRYPSTSRIRPVCANRFPAPSRPPCRGFVGSARRDRRP
jgi:hypothetical protein